MNFFQNWIVPQTRSNLCGSTSTRYFMMWPRLSWAAAGWKSLFIHRPARLRLISGSGGQELQKQRLQQLHCMTSQTRPARNARRRLFGSTRRESQLSGSWSDLIGATLKTRPAVWSWLGLCVGSGWGGAHSWSHKVISCGRGCSLSKNNNAPQICQEVGGQNQTAFHSIWLLQPNITAKVVWMGFIP